MNHKTGGKKAEKKQNATLARDVLYALETVGMGVAAMGCLCISFIFPHHPSHSSALGLSLKTPLDCKYVSCFYGLSLSSQRVDGGGRWGWGSSS